MKIGMTLSLVFLATPFVTADDEQTSVAEKTRVHRLSTNNRSPYDAFAYVNRIPESPGEGESPDDLSGRIFGRLANQEGRILLKLPPGMDRDTYNAFKRFFRYETTGTTTAGNCAACHTPVEFTDFKQHIVTKGGDPQPTPSLRNLNKRHLDLVQVLQDKIAAADQKRSGEANEIADAYSKMNITDKDIPGLVKFLAQLNDVDDEAFRKLILDSTLLDTSEPTE